MIPCVRLPLVVLALVFSATACGGSDETDSGQNLESLSTVTPVDRASISTGGIEMLATSFCGEERGDGLEMIVAGLQPSASLEATVNGEPVTFTADGDTPVIEYRLGSEPTFAIEVQVSNGTAELDVTGCQ